MHVRTKIICTIGPAVSRYEHFLALIDAGMNVARLNFSHGTHDQHKETIKLLKKAREERNVPLAIMLDTKGPEIRIGNIKNDFFNVEAGHKIELVKKQIEGTEEAVSITPPSVIDDLKVGMTILIDDGYILAKAVEKTNEGFLIEIQNRGAIKSHKGINIPHGEIDLPAMTDEDISDITFGIKQNVDLIAASFIRSPEHILAIKALLAKNKGSGIMVIAKIESALGVKNFDTIVQISDGIMIARGDLGVELPLTQVPKLQKMMIRKCYQVSKPVVTATQMLESMIYHPRPTRAEVSDVANAIYDSTSAIMLSGETAIGKYPIETVKMMRSIVEETEKDFNYAEFFYQDISTKRFTDVSSSVALASVKTAYTAKAKAIFVFTNSGFTARAVARFRPEIPILAMTPNIKTFHQLALNWGIVPVLGKVKDMHEGFKALSCFALKSHVVRYGDLVVVSAGTPFGISGTTNSMIVESIGDVLIRGVGSAGERITGKVAIALSTDAKKPHYYKDTLIVISRCDESFYPILEHVKGIILQNHPEDTASEKSAKKFASTHNIPLLKRADSASSILREGQIVTLDPSKGLIFNGVLESEEKMVSKVCPS